MTLIGYVDHLPDRRGGEVTVGLAVNRGPAAAPHPRTLGAGFDWSDPPAWVLDPFCPPPDPPDPPDPPETVRHVEQDRAFPRAGLWASHMGLRDGDGPFHSGPRRR